MSNFRPMDLVPARPAFLEHLNATAEDARAVAGFLKAVTDAHQQLLAELTPEGRALLTPKADPWIT